MGHYQQGDPEKNKATELKKNINIYSMQEVDVGKKTTWDNREPNEIRVLPICLLGFKG